MNFRMLPPSEYHRISGSSLVGEIVASFDEIREAFGDPGRPMDPAKTQVGWQLEFEDGTIATIYDWKKPFPVTLVQLWNIGGHDEMALDRVEEVVRMVQRDRYN